MIPSKKTARQELLEMYAKWRANGGEPKKPDIKDLPPKFNQLKKWAVKTETKIREKP